MARFVLARRLGLQRLGSTVGRTTSWKIFTTTMLSGDS